MAGQRTVVVLGGGISGLTFSYVLSLLKHQVLSVPGAAIPKLILLEKNSSTGGWMTTSFNSETGAIFENGPRSLRALGSPAAFCALDLVQKLGLADEVIYCSRKSDAGKNRFTYSNDRLNSVFPTSWWRWFAAQPPLSTSFASILMNEYRAPVQNADCDESVHSFFSRRVGKEVTEKLMDPMLRGVIAGDIKNTSILAFMGKMKEAEVKHGSITKGFRKIKDRTPVPVIPLAEDQRLFLRARKEVWAAWNFESGLQTMCDALHDELKSQGVDVRLQTPCTKLEQIGENFKVHTPDEVIDASMVVSTLNANITSSLLSETNNVLSKKLDDFNTVDMAVTTLEYPISRSSIPQGFGHLVPSSENEKNLGVIYDSVVFPEHDRPDNSTTRLTCMMGGAWFNDVFGDPEKVKLNQIDDVAVQSVSKQLGLKIEPVSVKSTVLRNAIPQYPVGVLEKLTDIMTQIQEDQIPLKLLGPAYSRPGVADCIRDAKMGAQLLLADWDALDYVEASTATVGKR